MKKKTLTTFIAVLAIVFSCSAQWTTLGTNIYNSNTGYVGIGTSTPGYNLTVAGDIANFASGTYSNLLSISYSNTSWHGPRIGFTRYRGVASTPSAVQNGDVSGWFDFFAYDGSANQRTGQFVMTVDGTVSSGIVPGRFMIATANSSGANLARLTAYSNDNISMANYGGRVGIGTESPSAKLEVSPGTMGYGMIINGGSVGSLRWGTGAQGALSWDTGKAIVYGLSGQALSLGADGSYNQLYIKPGGNVGIGTTNPDEKLTVYGKIHSQEVKVDLSVPGPDYVFEPTYKLPTLAEIKDFVDKNHHLPEIPTAAEMAKNGIVLGDMNTKLLKKVEELTLYLIEQNKRIEKLESELKHNTSQKRLGHINKNSRR